MFCNDQEESEFHLPTNRDGIIDIDPNLLTMNKGNNSVET